MRAHVPRLTVSDCRAVLIILLYDHGCACRVLQAATEVLHKALQTLHMKAEVSYRAEVVMVIVGV